MKSPVAYYNEIDPQAAAWLRELINHDLIAFGIVDERSIEDVKPEELNGFTQCHFFAGIGVWSYALRRAGWPDSRPIWTASCPCQPFSAAGEGAGFADERHLWPSFYHLVEQCEPSIVVGEQVASKAVDPWVDLVHADLEAVGYAFGCVPFPSAGVGAPHIRDRAYWVAYTDSEQHDRRRIARPGWWSEYSVGCAVSGLGHDDDARLEGHRGGHQTASGWRGTIRPVAAAGESRGTAQHDGHGCGALALAGIHDTEHHVEPRSSLVGLADEQGLGRGEQCSFAAGRDERSGAQEMEQRLGRRSILRDGGPAGPTNGLWRDADWLLCRDGKWRPVEPGTFPLAHGASARVGRLRGYGNAINAEAAQVFIETVMECLP